MTISLKPHVTIVTCFDMSMSSSGHYTYINTDCENAEVKSGVF